MLLIYIMFFLLLGYLIYLIVTYSGSEKPEYTLQYFRDKEFIKYPAIIIGYLNNKTIKPQHFIATALDFVCKGYIKLEKVADSKDYVFTILQEIKATPLEERALKFFFNTSSLPIGITQSLRQFKRIMRTERFFGNYGKVKRSFNKEIREYFDSKQEIIQITKKTNLKNIMLCYFFILIVTYILTVKNKSLFHIADSVVPTFFLSTFIFAIFLSVIQFTKSSLLGNRSFIFSLVMTVFFINTLFYIYLDFIVIAFLIFALMATIILFDDMLQRKKTNLANTCEMIKGLKRYIIDYSSIAEYDLSNVYLWDEYMVYAVALSIKNV